jgi:hypothetical protein
VAHLTSPNRQGSMKLRQATGRDRFVVLRFRCRGRCRRVCGQRDRSCCRCCFLAASNDRLLLLEPRRDHGEKAPDTDHRRPALVTDLTRAAASAWEVHPGALRNNFSWSVRWRAPQGSWQGCAKECQVRQAPARWHCGPLAPVVIGSHCENGIYGKNRECQARGTVALWVRRRVSEARIRQHEGQQIPAAKCLPVLRRRLLQMVVRNGRQECLPHEDEAHRGADIPVCHLLEKTLSLRRNPVPHGRRHYVSGWTIAPLFLLLT